MTREEIIANKSNLYGAGLRGADLCEANLCGADLCGANLRGANLRGANLRGADLCGANLRGADLRGADLQGADLCGANLCEADLQGADLQGADLWGANLCEANLCGANLCGANLWGANLCEANLRRAVGYDPYTIQPLYALRHHDGPISAYKIVSSAYESPYQAKNSRSYPIGSTVQIPRKECDPDEHELCGKGLHVATLQWCLNNKDGSDYRIIQVTHDPSDIVAIPFTSAGKYRVCKLTVVKEMTL